MAQKEFMTGVFSDLHFIAQRNDEGKYRCIPKHSGGNGTNMDFFVTNPKAKFYDTLDEALGNKSKHHARMEAIEEERQITGYYRREY
jgi:hypothetical protein